MLYILFGVIFVSSVFASSKKSSQLPLIGTCVNEGGGSCNSCNPEWKERFKKIFQARCQDERKDFLVYHDWVAHLLDAFVWEIWPAWESARVVRIFKVSRNDKCIDMEESAVEMLDQINKLNKWRKLNTCAMFKEKWKFACKPYREGHLAGWFFSKVVFEPVVLCAFTGVEDSSQIPKRVWDRLKYCADNWRKCINY